MNQIKNQKIKNKKKYSESKRQLIIAKGVNKTVNSKGYKKTIQPLVDKMIKDIDKQVVARKEKGVWTQGVNARPGHIKDDDYYARLFYYKQALIDFNNRVQSYIKSIDSLKKTINKLEAKSMEGEKENKGSRYWEDE